MVASRVTSELERWCRLIPGYDPWATADKGMEFDEDAALEAIGFFKDCLRHQEGDKALQPFILEDWQKGIIGTLYGWKTDKTKKIRRYREAFIFKPRKNGKTTLAAGIALKALFADGEYGAQVYSAAGDRDQAKLIYRQAAGMVRSDEDLNRMGKVYQNAIVFEERNSSYKAISREAGAAHGQNPHCVVVDELHVQKTRDLVDTLHTGMANRRQPMIVYITTAGYDKESICYEKYAYACNVRDGRVHDPSFLPVIYEAAPDDDWKDEDVWHKANPNLGVSVSLDYLRRECQRAQDIPAYENTFRRLHLNQWTEQDVRAIPMDQWAAALEDFKPEWFKGEPCYAGLDLASKQDVTALVLCFQRDERVYWLSFFWVPEGACLDRERRNRTRFDQWIRNKAMAKTNGNMTDYSFIRAKLSELKEIYDIREVAYDPWNGGQLAIQLAEEDGFTMVEFQQGYKSMSEPTKELLARLASGTLAHDGNPCLNWMAGNFAVETDAAGNLKPSKKKSTEKIDGIVAGIMALGRMIVAPLDQPEPSVLAW